MHPWRWLLLIVLLVSPDIVGAQRARVGGPTELVVEFRFVEALTDGVEDLHLERADDVDIDVDDGPWSLTAGRFQPFLDLPRALYDEPRGYRMVNGPRVVTRTGRGVLVRQRSRLPTTVRGAQGAERRWLSCELEARVTPRVRRDGSILLDIDLSRREPTPGSSELVERHAQLQIAVADGEAAYVRGMTATGTFARQDSARAVPLLGPLLGSRLDEPAELLMFVAPRIR